LIAGLDPIRALIQKRMARSIENASIGTVDAVLTQVDRAFAVWDLPAGPPEMQPAFLCSSRSFGHSAHSLYL